MIMNYECDYDLEHGEIKKIIYPEIAYAGPLGPCIAVSVYDKISKSGYIGFGFGMDLDLIKKTIDLAVEDFKNKSKLKISVAGANKLTPLRKDDFFSDEFCNDTWKGIEEIVESYGFNKRNVAVHRSKYSGMFHEMYLDCEHGKIVVFEKEEESLGITYD